MKQRWRTRAHLTAAVLALGAGLSSTPLPSASACMSMRASSSLHAPSLAVEEVLIVYDPASKTEHFVRQAVFRGDETPFGFIVPTPTRATVEPAPHVRFEVLERLFPFDRETSAPEQSADGRLGGPGGVSVLEKKRVGSFTAFVLAATDHDALSKWVKDNGLASDADTDAWLAHYVRAGFHFVALRYEPPKKKSEQSSVLRAETIRISFQTPAPYYPYLEPAREADGDRVLALWLVSTTPLVPVALERHGDTSAWVRPFAEGPSYGADVDGRLRRILSTDDGATLLPSDSVLVQTFEDQKRDRTGFGDVVFVPKTPRVLDEDAKTALAPLAAILDPALEAAP